MPNDTYTNSSCDLLSNFLTRSFLDLLEKFHIYKRHAEDLSHAKDLNQSIQSFLFILQNNPHHVTLLEEHIFNYLPGLSQQRFSPHIYHFISFRKVKYRYAKQLKSLSSYDPLLSNYNQKLVTSYYGIIYNHHKSLIHPIFTATSTNTFLIELWKYYVPILVYEENFNLLYTYLETFFNNHFDIAPTLLDITFDLIPDLKQNHPLYLLQKKYA